MDWARRDGPFRTYNLALGSTPTFDARNGVKEIGAWATIYENILLGQIHWSALSFAVLNTQDLASHPQSTDTPSSVLVK